MNDELITLLKDEARGDLDDNKKFAEVLRIIKDHLKCNNKLIANIALNHQATIQQWCAGREPKPNIKRIFYKRAIKYLEEMK